MKQFLFFLLLSCTFVVSGQTTFNYQEDFKKIRVRTKDSKDKLYYQNLLKRFSANDTSLTDFDVLALLIGFTDNPAFKPYQDVEIERGIYHLNGIGKYKEALLEANIFLKTHPLAVKTLFEKSFAFHKLGKEDSAQYYLYQGRKIFYAMYFSGDGKTKDSPIFALSPTDGQDYIKKFVGTNIGLMGSGTDKHGNFLDILEAKAKDGKSLTLYFIIQHARVKMF